MRIILTLLTLLQTVLLFSQTADVTTGCAPFEVKFTPPSGAVTFFWDFKDGSTSALSNPSNIFTTPGVYEVEFSATPNGPVLGTVTITVYPKPEVGFTAMPQSGCVPLNVQFTDTTNLAGDIQIQSYSWSFGDGNGGNTAAPSHLYSNPGSYTVSLELVTNYSTCNVTRIFSDYIKTGIKPTVNFTTNPNPPVSCAPPLNVSFTNTTSGGSGSLTYLWNFGNGNTSIFVDPPPQLYDQDGTYTVTLTATDAIGCSATVTRQVSVGLPTADFTIPDTICLGEPELIINTSTAGNNNWTFGPNAIPLTSTTKNPVVAFTAGGIQNITLTVTIPGTNCTSSITKPVFVEEADATFTVSPTYSCNDPVLFSFTPNANNLTQWKWTFSDSSMSNLQNPTFEWTSPDTTGYSPLGLWLDTVYLEVVSTAGCVGEYFLVDSIWRPNARMVPNRVDGCAPLTVTFADSSISNEPIVQWTWLFDDGSVPLINNTNDPVTHTFDNPGEYEVKLIIRNSAGCIDTSYIILIEVGEPIAGDFTVDKFEVCPGDSVQFTNLTNDPRVDAWHFSSESDRLWHCFQDDNPVWQYNNEADVMSVSLTTEYNGCFFTVTKDEFINVKGPIAHLHYKTTCDNTLEFEFTDESFSATNLTWYLGDGDSSIVSNFTHTYDMPGEYTVVLKAENSGSGCPISYDTATVYPTVLQSIFELPDTVCGGEEQLLDARNALGVNATCYKGYTWYFSFQRPIRTDKDTLSFLFGPSGTQTVWLEVEDINGCKDTLREDIVIYNRYPDFSVDDDTICIPSTVTFTDLSTADLGIVDWEWDFGDGNTSTDQNPTHTYTTPPPNGLFFEVQLTFHDEFGCVAVSSKNVYVYEPVSNILTLPQPPNICAGESISFTATDFTAGGSNLSWEWDFGNGDVSSNQGASTAYPNAGLFTVLLSFTEIATGCQGTNSIPVVVQGYPQASFTSNVDGLAIVCTNQIIEVNSTTTAGSPVSINWDLGNGVMFMGNQAITAFSDTGNYSITMIATTSFGCADTVSKSFRIISPFGNFIADPNPICKGDAVTFQLQDTFNISSWEWSFGDGSPVVANTNPVTHTYPFQPPSGFQTAKLVLYAEDDACNIIVEQQILFSQVNADFDVDATACVGFSVAFDNTSNSADEFLWTFGDGTSSTDFLADHIYTESGTYTVKLVVVDQPLGCMDSTEMTVTITGLDLETIDATICPGDTATIGVVAPALPDATFIWSPSNQIIGQNDIALVRVSPAQTTDYLVRVFNDDGCQDEATITVTVPAGYDGAMDLDTIVAKGSMVELPVTFDPDYSFSWMPPTFNPQNYPPVTPALDTSTTYTLTVVDALDCTESIFTFNIQVIPELVFAPNAFTPDFDGNNDVFKLLADGDESLVDVVNLKVYSRWGQLMYEGTGPLSSIGWDGRVDGKDAVSDVYVWFAEVAFLTGKRVNLKGDVTLLR